jgi:ABC-type transport system involved in multi-copper enzyme maturation permease subunit
MPRSPTRLLLRDELIGFAKSKVMIVMWVVLPIIAMAAYLLLPEKLLEARGVSRQDISATAFISFLMSSLAGTVAALMVAVDLVSERNRKVYELFVIRPIPRSAIIWSKFFAVFTCVSVACVCSIFAGLIVDWLRGRSLIGEDMRELVKPMVSLIGVIAVSTGIGVVFGTLARSIIAAVVLILYVGQNLAIVPMLPIYLGILPNQFWLLMLISFAMAGGLVLIAARVFKRAEF